jgi:hypothetical protein
MYGSSGSLSQTDLKAFKFLYFATSFTLKHSALYHNVSASLCAALMNPSAHPPSLRKKDFSLQTRPLLGEFVEACADLVDQFAHPAILILAFTTGKRVVHYAYIVGEYNEIKKKRQKIQEWRQAGEHALVTA